MCIDLIDSLGERLHFATLNNDCAETAIIAASFGDAWTFVKCALQFIAPHLEDLPEAADLARSIYLNVVIAHYRL
jgi:hypothetical protein